MCQIQGISNKFSVMLEYSSLVQLIFDIVFMRFEPMGEA
tara:strand:+ start:432 stop:548 length:117 start_codon:yes stop_codon:yes gene_type:complete